MNLAFKNGKMIVYNYYKIKENTFYSEQKLWFDVFSYLPEGKSLIYHMPGA